MGIGDWIKFELFQILIRNIHPDSNLKSVIKITSFLSLHNYKKHTDRLQGDPFLA